MDTSIAPIYGENIRVQNNHSNVRPRISLTIPPDEFVRTTNVPCEKCVSSKIVDDWRNSSNENKMVDLLYKEYESIKPENFDSIEEYEKAKQDAYERWKDAVKTSTDNSNGRGETNANIFAKTWNALCEGIKKAGDTILNLIPFLSAKSE